MQNPVRTVLQRLNKDFRAEVAQETDIHEVKAVRAVSKFWICSFSILGAMVGWELVDGHERVDFQSDDTATTVAEYALETAIVLPQLLVGGIALSTVIEGVQLHRGATKRVEELSGQAGEPNV